MFRELIRKKQQLTNEECIRVLKQEKRGVLSVNGEDGYPYGMPMNHWYDEESGKLYFHSGKVGHRLDALKQNNKVSFCVYDSGTREDGKWALRFRSVIVFGRIVIVDDMDRIVDVTAKLNRKFTEDETYIQNEIAQYARGTLLLELTVEHMCGKTVEES